MQSRTAGFEPSIRSPAIDMVGESSPAIPARPTARADQPSSGVDRLHSSRCTDYQGMQAGVRVEGMRVADHSAKPAAGCPRPGAAQPLPRSVRTSSTAPLSPVLRTDSAQVRRAGCVCTSPWPDTQVHRSSRARRALTSLPSLLSQRAASQCKSTSAAESDDMGTGCRFVPNRLVRPVRGRSGPAVRTGRSGRSTCGNEEGANRLPRDLVRTFIWGG